MLNDPTVTTSGVARVRTAPIRTIGGVSAMRSPKPPAAALAPAHSDFTFNGGPIIGNPIIYPTFWGALWPDAAHLPQAHRLIQFINDLLNSDWMNILTQYGVGQGAGSGILMPATYIGDVHGTLTDAQIQSNLRSAIFSGDLPEPPPDNRSVVVGIFLDETLTVNDPGLQIVMCEPNHDTAFGYHSHFVTPQGHLCFYSVVPSLDDMCLANACPPPSLDCSLSPDETQEQRRTQVFSHEFAEMTTDPQFPTGWWGPISDEIGDICTGEVSLITVRNRTWHVQRIYSKADDERTNGTVFCIGSAPEPLPLLPEAPKRFAPAFVGIGSATRNSDGRIELFAVGTDNALWHIWQNDPHSGNWSGWESLGWNVNGDPAVALNSDGRLEVFVRSAGQLWHIWQEHPHSGPWSDWSSLGGTITSSPAVAVAGGGFLDVFARGDDNALWYLFQTNPHAGPWSAWTPLGGVITSDPAAAVNRDGRVEVFARGTDDALWHIRQLSTRFGGWSQWESLYGAISSDPAVILNSDGRLEVFARGADGAIWRISQTNPDLNSWSTWSSLSRHRRFIGFVHGYTGDPVVSMNADGTLEVFARGSDAALSHIHEDTPGGTWSGWSSLGGILTSDPIAVGTSDGRLEVFVRGTDGALWHTSQTSPNGGPWSPWTSLGGILITPPAD